MPVVSDGQGSEVRLLGPDTSTRAGLYTILAPGVTLRLHVLCFRGGEEAGGGSVQQRHRLSVRRG